MNKQEAQEALRAGEFISHNMFVEGEHIHQDKDGNIIDENNNKLPEFWKWRNDDKWYHGWFIVLPSAKDIMCMGMEFESNSLN